MRARRSLIFFARGATARSSRFARMAEQPPPFSFRSRGGATAALLFSLAWRSNRRPSLFARVAEQPPARPLLSRCHGFDAHNRARDRRAAGGRASDRASQKAEAAARHARRD